MGGSQCKDNVQTAGVPMQKQKTVCVQPYILDVHEQRMYGISLP